MDDVVCHLGQVERDGWYPGGERWYDGSVPMPIQLFKFSYNIFCSNAFARISVEVQCFAIDTSLRSFVATADPP